VKNNSDLNQCSD